MVSNLPGGSVITSTPCLLESTSSHRSPPATGRGRAYDQPVAIATGGHPVFSPKRRADTKPCGRVSRPKPGCRRRYSISLRRGRDSSSGRTLESPRSFGVERSRRRAVDQIGRQAWTAATSSLGKRDRRCHMSGDPRCPVRGSRPRPHASRSCGWRCSHECRTTPCQGPRCWCRKESRAPDRHRVEARATKRCCITPQAAVPVPWLVRTRRSDVGGGSVDAVVAAISRPWPGASDHPSGAAPPLGPGGPGRGRGISSRQRDQCWVHPGRRSSGGGPGPASGRPAVGRLTATCR